MLACTEQFHQLWKWSRALQVSPMCPQVWEAPGEVSPRPTAHLSVSIWGCLVCEGQNPPVSHMGCTWLAASVLRGKQTVSGSLHFACRPSSTFTVVSPSCWSPPDHIRWSISFTSPVSCQVEEGQPSGYAGSGRGSATSLVPYIQGILQFSALLCTPAFRFPRLCGVLRGTLTLFLLASPTAGFRSWDLWSDKSCNSHFSLSSSP